jgi:hypothetical protein
MGIYLVVGFLALFALAIGQAFLRRRLDPYQEVAWMELPAELREETERVLPGFEPQRSIITKKGIEARIEGCYQGRGMRVEGEFDSSGKLVEFEADGEGGFRKRGMVAPEELPGAVVGEIQRLLGDVFSRLERRMATRGTSGGEECFGLRGLHGEWKYEVEVSGSGRLLGFERELRGRRS